MHLQYSSFCSKGLSPVILHDGELSPDEILEVKLLCKYHTNCANAGEEGVEARESDLALCGQSFKMVR